MLLRRTARCDNRFEPLGVRSCNLNLDARSHAPSSHTPQTKGIPNTESSVSINPLDRGLRRSPLHGVPVAVKDLCDTTFAPTSAGMGLRKHHRAQSNATVVERLETAGAIILGKLATTEGAFSSHHPDLRTPINPWNPKHWPGASSSGSGVATAAGLCFGAIGTDTGGSIRFPSSACGLVGVMPTQGRVSGAGVFPLSKTLDRVGPMTRTAEDAAAMLTAIAGYDQRDPISANVPSTDYLVASVGDMSSVTIGIDRSIEALVDPEVMKVLTNATAVFQALGARLVEIDLPSSDAVKEGYMDLLATEAAIAHSGLFPENRPHYGEGLAQLLDRAPHVDPISIARTWGERTSYTARVNSLFQQVDLVLVPALPHLVRPADDWATPDSALFTLPFNMTGHPTITLCGGFDEDGLPIGFQLVARHFDESLLLRSGRSFQKLTDWHTKHPTDFGTK